MLWSEQYQALSTRDKEELRTVLNQLIGETFLVKRKENNRQAYYFVERHFALLQDYLKVLGWELILDRGNGVCQLSGREGGQRQGLSVIHSVLLLILRLLYEQQRKQLTLTDDVIVLTQDIQDQYLALKMRGRPLEKTVLREGMALFKRYNLVEPLDGDVTAPECRIKLYPSLLFAVRVDSLQTLHERLLAYMNPDGAMENGGADDAAVEEARQ